MAKNTYYVFYYVTLLCILIKTRLNVWIKTKCLCLFRRKRRNADPNSTPKKPKTDDDDFLVTPPPADDSDDAEENENGGYASTHKFSSTAPCVPAHRILHSLAERVKPLIQDLAEALNQLRMWITYLVRAIKTTENATLCARINSEDDFCSPIDCH